jgi:hypothetical protein
VATSKWGQVVDALVTAMAAETGYRRAGTRGNDVAVFDSLEVGLADEWDTSWLVVGWSDPEAGEDSPGSVDADFFAMHGGRSEQGVIQCRAEVTRGDRDIAAARTAASAILDDVIELLRGDVTIGGVVKRVNVTSYLPSQEAGNGVRFCWTFTVEYMSDI